MNDYLRNLRDTHAAYVAGIAKIDQMRAELRDALGVGVEANIEGPLYVHDELDDLFAPEFTDGQLEAIFCDPFSECDGGIC